MIRAALLDFDGTLVTADILDVICGINGKEDESRRINREFHEGKRSGIDALVERINFCRGISVRQIHKKLGENSFLMPGAQSLLDFLRRNHIITILHSGNIEPVLSFYQRLLGIQYIIGTKPRIVGSVIEGMSPEESPGKNFKLLGVQHILSGLTIPGEETVAIGDSPADRSVFEFSKYSIAINPKGNIADFATYVIHDDLSGAIPIIQEFIV